MVATVIGSGGSGSVVVDAASVTAANGGTSSDVAGAPGHAVIGANRDRSWNRAARTMGIARARGDVPVERLAVAECVVGPSGGAMPMPWLDHRHAECRGMFVRVVSGACRCAPDAFRAAAPACDLARPPDHAVFVAPPGLRPFSMPVRFVVDGGGIMVVRPRRSRITWRHVMPESSAVRPAEARSCETQQDAGNRAGIANGGPAVSSHPDHADAHWQRRIDARQARGGPALDQARRPPAPRRSDSSA